MSTTALNTTALDTTTLSTPAMVLGGSGAVLLLAGLAGLAGAAGAVGGIVAFSGSVPPRLAAVSRALCTGLGSLVALGAVLLLAGLSSATVDGDVPAAQPAQSPAAQTVTRAVPPYADTPRAGGPGTGEAGAGDHSGPG